MAVAAVDPTWDLVCRPRPVIWSGASRDQTTKSRTGGHPLYFLKLSNRGKGWRKSFRRVLEILLRKFSFDKTAVDTVMLVSPQLTWNLIRADANKVLGSIKILCLMEKQKCSQVELVLCNRQVIYLKVCSITATCRVFLFEDIHFIDWW